MILNMEDHDDQRRLSDPDTWNLQKPLIVDFIQSVRNRTSFTITEKFYTRNVDSLKPFLRHTLEKWQVFWWPTPPTFSWQDKSMEWDWDCFPFMPWQTMPASKLLQNLANVQSVVNVQAQCEHCDWPWQQSISDCPDWDQGGWGDQPKLHVWGALHPHQEEEPLPVLAFWLLLL